MKKFDERGEAAIARLRLDPDFNEELYRKLGPVQYWTHVNARKARGIPPNPHNIPACKYRCKAMMDLEQRCVELRGHDPVVDPHGRTWDHRSFVNGSASFWRVIPPKKEETVQPKKEHDKSAVTATRILIIGIATSVTLILVTIAVAISAAIWQAIV